MCHAIANLAERRRHGRRAAPREQLAVLVGVVVQPAQVVCELGAARGARAGGRSTAFRCAVHSSVVVGSRASRANEQASPAASTVTKAGGGRRGDEIRPDAANARHTHTPRRSISASAMVGRRSRPNPFPSTRTMVGRRSPFAPPPHLPARLAHHLLKRVVRANVDQRAPPRGEALHDVRRAEVDGHDAERERTVVGLGDVVDRAHALEHDQELVPRVM